MPDLEENDQRQIARRKWRVEKVNYLPVGRLGMCRSVMIRGRRRLAQSVFQKIKNLSIGLYAYTAAFPELTALALREPADWFIAHAHATLPIAAAAAQRWHARLGFDCEDWLAENGTDPVEIVRLIEREYLHACDYVSAPCMGIAERLAQVYGVREPLLLYNVFPEYLADKMPAPTARETGPILKIHWFGQTIGPGRGIEDAVQAAGMLGQQVELHLRGNPAHGYREALEVLAQGAGATLQFHPQIDHDDLIKSLGQFDVGLSLERPDHGNYSLAATNKFFSYMLGGLALAVTDTPGHKEILQQVPSAGFIYCAGQPQVLAAGLRRWLHDREALHSAQQAAWDAARKKFCWDIEKEKFLELFRADSLSA
jgi:glycosyltransferase involved in cell wall biosynthesis